MLFNSIDFLIFFILVTLCYFMINHKYRWALLLAASCIFYMFFIPAYILILLATIIIDYAAGIFIEKVENQHRKKMLLIISIISNVGILVYFKYYNFFIENVNFLLGKTGSSYEFNLLNIILPIGLSFHTFQAMSYTIEVYRGKQKAEKHFGIYSLYVLFYPQLVAGPIERPQNILHQLHTKHNFSYENMTSGLKLMLWGLFKKVVIADRLAIYVNSVYSNVHEYNGFPLLWAGLFFSIQIYCDFSGYSDIAIGSARTMGINLMTNFSRPYLSKSIKEFWSKWHISLSTWFRDYVYIPLGGNRNGTLKWYRNLMIIFLLSGFWHGANWTFVIWGALHGLYLILSILIEKTNILSHSKSIFINSSKIIFTFFLVTIAWVFFRADNINDAFYFISHMFNLKGSNFIGVPIFTKYSFILCIISVLIILLTDFAFEKKLFENLKTKKAYIYTSIAIMIAVIYLFGIFEKQEFIYFQF